MRSLGELLGMAWILALTAALHAQSFEYYFDGVSFEETIEGEPVRFRANAMLESRGTVDPALGAEAWQVAIETLGCFVTGATTRETASDVAPLPDDPGGEIPPGTGFLHLEVTGNSVVLAVVRDLRRPDPLPPSDSPHVLLRLDLEGDEGCTSCLLEHVDGLPSQGRDVDNVVTADGRTVRPLLKPLSFDWRPAPCTEPPVDLDPVVTHTFSRTLTRCNPGACFAFDVREGKEVILEFTDSGAGGDYELFFRWRDRATPREFDVSRAVLGGTDRVVLPSAPGGAGFVSIVPLDPSRQGTVSLTATQADLVLESADPDRVPRNQDVRINAEGAGFRRRITRFSLQSRDGAVILPAVGEPQVITRGRAVAVFRIPADQPLGSRLDLRAENGPDVVAVLEGAVEIAESGTEALHVVLSGPPQPVVDVPSRLDLMYRNDDRVPRTAPLFRVRASAGVLLKLRQDDEFREGPLLVLGVDPEASAGELSSDRLRCLPLEFLATEAGGIRFEVDLVIPSAEPFEWSEVPAPDGISGTRWREIVDDVETSLGDNWSSVHRELAERASRVSLRGIDGASLDKMFRFAVRGILGRPTSAIGGTLFDADGETPLMGAEVVAFQDGTAVSASTSDADGNFAIDWLESGQAYTLEIVGRGGSAQILPEDWEGEDIFGVEIVGSPSSNNLNADCANCNETDLPTAVPSPAGRFDFEGAFNTVAFGSVDPNSKDGPGGQEVPNTDIPFNFIGPDEEQIYQINFENVGTGPAKRVVIDDQLSPVFERKTVRFRSAGFSGNLFHLDQDCKDQLHSGGHCPVREGDYHVETTVFGTHFWNGQQREFWVRITADAEPRNGRLEWTFTTLVPGLDGRLVEPTELEPDLGFLPPSCPQECRGTGCGEDCLDEMCVVEVCDLPVDDQPPVCTDEAFPQCLESCLVNDCASIGTGFVTFSVELRGDLSEDTVVSNTANIKFDPTAPCGVESGVDGGDESEDERNCGIVTEPAPVNAYSRFDPAEQPGVVSPFNGETGVSARPRLEWLLPGDAENTANYDIYLWRCEVNPASRPEDPGDISHSWKDHPGPAVRLEPVPYVDVPPGDPLDFLTGYCWQVVAKNKKNVGTPSDVWTFTTGCPGIPEGLMAQGNPRPVLTWTAQRGDASYDVFLQPCGADLVLEAEGLEVATYTLDRDLSPGCYEWLVRAHRENEECTRDSAVATFAVCPERPSGLAVEADRCSPTPRLSWNVVDGASGYSVIVRSVSGEERFAMRGVTGTSYTVPDFAALEAGRYTWVVAPEVGDGLRCGSESEPAELTIGPAPPSSLPVDRSDCTVRRPTLNWQQSEGAERYEVFVKRAGEPVPAPEASVASGPYVLERDLPPGLYEFWVVAHIGDCSSEPSVSQAFEICPGEVFVRGDTDSTGAINVTDGIIVLDWLFLGGPEPRCLDAADSDDSGEIVLTDAVITFQWLFTGGAAPKAPSPSVANYEAADCGVDPTDDSLGCADLATDCSGA